MVIKLIGVKEFRANMASYALKARQRGWHYVVLSRNEPIFKVTPLSKKEKAVQKLAAEIAEAREDVKAGRVYSVKQVLKHLGL